MKALTLTQPWATLVALGAKTIETRSWHTCYRGPLAIHAAKGFPGWAKRQCFLPPFSYVLASNGLSPDTLPRCEVLCLTELLDCRQGYAVDFSKYPPHEEAFGNYGPDRFCWFLGAVTPLPKPVAARGSLGLWNFAFSLHDFKEG